ncbi:aldo/keto reductase [Zobellia sp. 1_MG-2023]|uniref:aldo/keto reductase n=1 Tax=Zobellia sp. 1_MG-2023 TaxID=3062626 RepID=UPI0026E1173D|nr:aldo/keto reductase [Zobellia sp. 1_MG-2023]MDO6820568.1 aldo/keto reductase [Zobellia sp. 1_MG-2023]
MTDNPSKTKIGLGMAALGRPEYINIDEGNRDKSLVAFRANAFKVLDAAYEKGVRYFDTAPSYGKGEEFLKDWQDNRAHTDVVLGTKWGYTYVANWQLGYDGPHEVKEHSLEKLTEQWEFSKGLLPFLEFYQIHSATFESGVLQNKPVLEKLLEIKRTTGLTIGISTSGPNQKEVIENALQIRIDGEVVFDSFQVTFNMLEQAVLPVLRDIKLQDKKLIVKEAMANGRIFENEKYPQYQSLYTKLKTLAEKYEVGVDAIALRYVMDKVQPDYVLSGAADIHQLEQNLKANSFTLNEEELAELTKEKVNSKAYWEERSRLSWD